MLIERNAIVQPPRTNSHPQKNGLTNRIITDVSDTQVIIVTDEFSYPCMIDRFCLFCTDSRAISHTTEIFFSLSRSQWSQRSEAFSLRFTKSVLLASRECSGRHGIGSGPGASSPSVDHFLLLMRSLHAATSAISDRPQGQGSWALASGSAKLRSIYGVIIPVWNDMCGSCSGECIAKQ